MGSTRSVDGADPTLVTRPGEACAVSSEPVDLRAELDQRVHDPDIGELARSVNQFAAKSGWYSSVWPLPERTEGGRST